MADDDAKTTRFTLQSLATTTTLSVPSRLFLFVVTGSSTDRWTEGRAAW